MLIYRFCLPVRVSPRKTVAFHVYLWCSEFYEFHSNIQSSSSFLRKSHHYQVEIEPQVWQYRVP